MGQTWATPTSAKATSLPTAMRGESAAILDQDLFGNAFMTQSVLEGSTSGEPSGEASPSDFSTRAKALFPVIDFEDDGYLSAAEIDAAVADTLYEDEDACVVATLNLLSDELEELSDDEWGDENDGVTLADLEAYERSGNVPGSLRERVEWRYERAKLRLAAVDPTLWGRFGEPTVHEIKQGGIGDCFFIAAVTAMVQRDPKEVMAMIADNGDDTYTVTFPERDPITVAGPTEAELAAFATSGDDGIWLPVLEKAFGRLRDPDAIVPSESAGGLGMNLGSGIGAITGHAVDIVSLDLNSQAYVAEQLTLAFDEKRLVTASIRRNIPGTDPSRDNGLPMGHEYTVLWWDGGSQVITVRNPWGSGEVDDENGRAADGQDDGQFTMPLTDFVGSFNNLAIEQSE